MSALSCIFFKMGWEKEMSKVQFTGNQISLRDLKDQIIEIKKLKNGRADWNFDLVVKDSEDPNKEYTGDETYLPKFSSVTVKRGPMIKSSSAASSKSSAQKSNTVIAPTVFISEAPSNSGIVHTGSSSSNENNILGNDVDINAEEEEMRMLREQRIKISVRNTQQSYNGNTGVANRGHKKIAECVKCGKLGHYAGACPEAGGFRMTGAQDNKIHGVPEALLKNVHTDEATGKETIAPDQAEHARIVAEGGLANVMKNIDMSTLPSNLKCAVSGNILEDAVLLPCCRKTVSDGVIRAALVNSNMKCPLCHKTNVSVDDLMADEKARSALEQFILQSKAKANDVISDKDSTDIVAKQPSPASASSVVPSGMDPMSQFSQQAMMMSMMSGGGGQGMNPMQLQQMMGSMNMMASGTMMMQPMPGPYPGWLMDPFTGNMLPFDPSLIPWNMLPLREFPSPVEYDVFIREQKMQRDYKEKVADSRNSSRSSNNSPYNLSETPSGKSKPQPPVKERKETKTSAKEMKETKTCPHGRTVGYCSTCKEEISSNASDEKPTLQQKKEIKVCPHGRTEGYCTTCNSDADKNPPIERATQKKKDINTCSHGRTTGYCSICSGDNGDSSNRGNARPEGRRGDRKRSRSRDNDDEKNNHEGRDKKKHKEPDRRDRGRERSPSAQPRRKVVYRENEKKGKKKKKTKNDLRYLIKTVAKGKR